MTIICEDYCTREHRFYICMVVKFSIVSAFKEKCVLNNNYEIDFFHYSSPHRCKSFVRVICKTLTKERKYAYQSLFDKYSKSVRSCAFEYLNMKMIRLIIF